MVKYTLSRMMAIREQGEGQEHPLLKGCRDVVGEDDIILWLEGDEGLTQGWCPSLLQN